MRKIPFYAEFSNKRKRKPFITVYDHDLTEQEAHKKRTDDLRHCPTVPMTPGESLEWGKKYIERIRRK